MERVLGKLAGEEGDREDVRVNSAYLHSGALRNDLALFVELSYLCGMTSRATWVVLALLTVIPLRVEAQHWYGGFSPESVFFAAPANSGVLSFGTNFTVYSDSVMNFNFEGSSGITADPSSVMCWGGRFPTQAHIRISVNLKDWVQPPCTGMPNGVIVQPSGLYGYFMIFGYVYDPKIVGRARSDTTLLSFGQVDTASIASQSLSRHIFIDSLGSRYRYLKILNVRAPFYADDSIEPMFAGTGPVGGYCVMDHDHEGFARFQPKQPGHYVDTTFLFDPLRGDSTMLLLEGDGVNAPEQDVEFAPTKVSPVSIYPNPCSDAATIALHGMRFDQITIRNILGTRVKEFRDVSSDLVFDASLVPDGLYLLEAQTRDKVVTMRFLVAH
ncbi:MAG: T9SS type A sorting domain-containing protein [Bacteroidota bacterium]|nr:T9SS type A sorting domain-containing protein [Bacteroidota bacterium]MDP4233190.1 T9SS type A sorting domain-containing protein [Bacteroidota bacterium]MDP4242191.1 T9SS type A sorting domain-containing protein [Bacteroidota bacterium]MDP4287842.1 T9SS type A sorting domain-containing protein [Bacteroidota bacterium]